MAVATDLNNLAVCLYRAGRSVEYDALHARAWRSGAASIHSGASDIAGTLTGLGSLLRDVGRLDEARATEELTAICEPAHEMVCRGRDAVRELGRDPSP